MARAARDYDESDVRIRPNPRGSRPRSKDRPAHADAVPGRVVGVDRGRYTTIVEDAAGGHVVTAMRARELGRKGIVLGDHVHLVGDVSGADGSLARIVRVSPRETVLRRTADDTDPVERVLVANADQLVVVCALADPEPRPRMIDRCLVAAYDAGMDALLVLTKADLAHHLNGALFKHSSAKAGAHVIFWGSFNDDRLYTLQMQQMGKHQSSGTSSYDANLCPHH